MRNIVSGFGNLAIVALIAAAFLVGLALTIYLSLRSPEVPVPEVVSKSYLDGETELARVGLDIRERAKRFKPGIEPGVILDQSPRAGEVIKQGQTVAVVVSRAPKEGEEALAAQAEEARRAEEEAQGTVVNRNDNRSDASANQNRERRRNTNRNTNANSNANTNQSRSENRNSALNTNTGNANNRNAGRNVNGNVARPTNANQNRVAIPPPRNANVGRPAVNANRRPAP